jgi:stringent starvation protein B
MKLTKETIENVCISLNRDGLEPILITKEIVYNMSHAAIKALKITENDVRFIAFFNRSARVVVVLLDDIEKIIGA